MPQVGGASGQHITRADSSRRDVHLHHPIRAGVGAPTLIAQGLGRVQGRQVDGVGGRALLLDDLGLPLAVGIALLLHPQPVVGRLGEGEGEEPVRPGDDGARYGRREGGLYCRPQRSEGSGTRQPCVYLALASRTHTS